MIYYVCVENDTLVQWDILLYQLQEWYPESGIVQGWPGGIVDGKTYVQIATMEPPQYQFDETLVQKPPVLLNGVWTQQWEVAKLSSEIVSQKTYALVTGIKNSRNANLRTSDWTMLSDAPLSTEEREQWRIYRQALRDITLQEGYPFTVVWPQEPAKAADLSVTRI